MKRILFALIGLSFSLPTLLPAQDVDRKAHYEAYKALRAQNKAKVKEYLQTEVKPVLSTQRVKLDAHLTAEEKRNLDQIRLELSTMKAARMEEMKKMKAQFDEGNKPSEAEREKIRAAMRESRESHRELLEQARGIADNHSEVIDQLLEEIRPQAATWRKDMRALAMEGMKERENAGGRYHGKAGPRRGKGNMGHRDAGSLRQYFRPTGFLLWEGGNLTGTQAVLYNLNTYPNPGKGVNTLEYEVLEAGEVVIRLLNERAEVVKEVVQETQEAGNHKISVDLSGLPAGLYFYQIQSGEALLTRKLIIEE
ncbi:MAG: T9SS type A sorting domain-containing protein [Bacteroidota bacterium]